MKTAGNRLFAAFAATVFLATHGSAQDSISRKDLDGKLDAALFNVAQIGTNLFNDKNDIDGCARLYEGALRAVLPLLDNRTELKDRVENAFKKAERQNEADRAHTFRDAIDDIRATIRPGSGSGPSVPKKTPESESKPNTPAPNPNVRPPLGSQPLQTGSLWTRLGGTDKIRQFVNDAVANMAAEPKLNLSRGERYTDNAKLAASLIDYISSLSGGPFKYKGKDMKTAHAGMQITEEQFNIFRAKLAAAMQNESLKIDPKAVAEFLAHVDATKKEIVEK